MPHHTQPTILTEKVLGVTDAAGDLILQTNPRTPGRVLVFEVVSCRCVGAQAVATIEFVQGTTVYGLRTLTLTNANSWYKTRGPVRLPSDYHARVTFSNGGNTQVCETSIYGYEVCPE